MEDAWTTREPVQRRGRQADRETGKVAMSRASLFRGTDQSRILLWPRPREGARALLSLFFQVGPAVRHKLGA